MTNLAGGDLGLNLHTGHKGALSFLILLCVTLNWSWSIFKKKKFFEKQILNSSVHYLNVQQPHTKKLQQINDWTWVSVAVLRHLVLTTGVRYRNASG